MKYVTVGPKYQIVIPKDVRRKVKGIKPGGRVSVQATKNLVTVKPESKSWADETRGIAKEAWKDIDTTKYLEDLRNEWDREI